MHILEGGDPISPSNGTCELPPQLGKNPESAHNGYIEIGTGYSDYFTLVILSDKSQTKDSWYYRENTSRL